MAYTKEQTREWLLLQCRYYSGIPLSLYCCFGKNRVRTFTIGFAHEAEENFAAFMWNYMGINYYTREKLEE